MFPSNALALAARFHRFGGLAPAEQLYRRVVQEQPDHAEARAGLGDVCHALGRRDEAVHSYRRSLELHPESVRVRNRLGVVLQELGRLDDAIACFREALRLQPDAADSYHNLGSVLVAQGRLDEAAAALREALRLEPTSAAAYHHLGQILSRQGRDEEAAACCGRAVQLQPALFPAWLQLADSLKRLGRRDEAGACWERAAQLRPGDPASLTQLGTLLLELGRAAEAIACYERALRLRPDSAATCSNLGLSLLHGERVEEARLAFEQALYLEPDLPEVHNNLGLALLRLGRAEEAGRSFRRAVELRPDFADAYNNWGLAFDAVGNPDEAWSCFERAVQLQPNHVGALANLGWFCNGRGDWTEGIACYRRVLALQPEDARTHSNLLLALLYQPGTDPREIRDEACRYAQQHAAPLAGTIQPHAVRPRTGRRLRIGYVSADFCEHSGAHFLEPILANHDHQHFEIFCYANVRRPDAWTKRFQGYADRWLSIAGMSDNQAAETIRRDGIDVLVDLSGHLGDNRLLIFARKPAPVQASYLGDLGTTGLPTIDYYLTDAHADPPGWTEEHYQEEVFRLPQCALCYWPGPAPDIDVGRIGNPSHPAGRIGNPSYRMGQTTFACLNTAAKLSEEVLALWSRILAAIPGSRLLLRAAGGRRGEERIRDILARCEVSPERLVLLGWMASRFDYLKAYREVAVCLDPFPYNGVTTTCDSLWMGVPVVALAGRMSVSRQGVRLLRNVGLDELIAVTPEDYVRIATALAGDSTRLAALRAGLREQMRRSPLMDAQGCTRRMEAAYREMWDKWAARA